MTNLLGISDLVPPSVAVVETRMPSVLAEEPLWPEEQALLGPRAGAKRRYDFTAGRACARRALIKVGVPSVAILTGSHRQPLWPTGIVGSITHCAGRCAAAVARATDVMALGIDVEEHAALPTTIVTEICSPLEQKWIWSLPDTGIHWPSLVFSAKESIYKAWFPLTGSWLGFEDVNLTIDLDRGVFHAEFLVELGAVARCWPARVSGRFGITSEHILTAVVLPALHA